MLSWLAYNSLCALPLVLLAVLARRWARSAPGLEHALWVLVLVRLVWPAFPGGPATASAATPAVVSSGPTGLGDELVAATTRLLGPNWSTWTLGILVALYLAGVLWTLGRELARAHAVARCVRALPAADPRVRRRVRTLAARLGVRAPDVRVAADLAGPFLWSPWRPVLVLPETTPADPVLAHELAHLARRDPWSAWLELVVEAVHFWNPLFHLARRARARAAELACDRWVLARFPAQGRAYAVALVETAERAAGVVPMPRAAHALGHDARELEERLQRILAPPPRVRRIALATLALGALALTPGWAAPSLERFRAALPGLPAGTDQEHWRRTLAAAETRLAADSSDGEAHLARGLALLGLGRADEALAAFRAQAASGHKPAVAAYNQACAHLRRGDPEGALASLHEAAALGLDVAACVAADPDLASLRGHPALPR